MICTLFSLCSGLLLGVGFLRAEWGALVLVAFVPAFRITACSTLLRTFYTGMVVGILGFSLANYWVYSFAFNLTASVEQSIVIFAVYVIYSAFGVCLFLIGFWLLNRWLPEYAQWITLPAFGTAFFSGYPFLFDFSLAASQAGNSAILEPIALTGHWGLSFVVLMANYSSFKLLMAFERKQKVQTVIAGSAAVVLFAAWFSMAWVIKPDNKAETVPLKIGFHQMNDRPRVSELRARPPYTLGYTQALENSYTLAQQGAEIIVWPESRPKGLLLHHWVAQAYQAHSNEIQVPLIVQDIGKSREPITGQRNSSIFFSPGNEWKIYHKIKRIPFGEYMPETITLLPFGDRISEMFKGINKNIVAGKSVEIFESPRGNILPLLCFEVLSSLFVSSGIQKNPSVGLIVLQSNVAWFFSASQSRMHNNYAVLRAVETQRPVLHITNSGASYFIQPNGRIAWSVAGEQTGSYLAEVMIPGEVAALTLATRYPGWFLQVTALLSLLAFITVFLRTVWGLPPELRNAES